MKKTFNDNLTVCNWKDLMCDGDFMDKDRIKEECNCLKKGYCQMLVDLLENGQLDLALNLLNDGNTRYA